MIIDVRNPRYIDANAERIICTIDTQDVQGLPFLMDRSDAHLDPPDIFERVISGEFGEVAAFVENLAIAKRAAAEQIDRQAEAARLRVITGGVGQAWSYQQKSDEAARYIAAGEPQDASAYPWVEATAEGRQITPSAAAHLIADRAAEVQRVFVAIEGAREAAKDAVNTATTSTEINEAVQAAGEAFASVAQ
jgi:hypothetical protein